VVVAVSQDSEPEESSKIRELVETTLAQKNIQLTGTPVGQIALDPKGKIGTAFRVASLPTVVLLDAKGVVQSAHVGVPRDARDMRRVREGLVTEIASRLAGKSLATPKGGTPAAGKD